MRRQQLLDRILELAIDFNRRGVPVLDLGREPEAHPELMDQLIEALSREILVGNVERTDEAVLIWNELACACCQGADFFLDLLQVCF